LLENSLRLPLRRVLLFAVLALVAPTAATACQFAQLANMPVSFATGSPTVDININGHVLHMLIDTGAQDSVLTKAAMKLVKADYIYGTTTTEVGPNGQVDSTATFIRRFDIGGITLLNKPFFVMDLDDSNTGAATKIDGAIGESILHSYNIALDFPHGQISLIQEDSCRGGMPFVGPFAKLSFTLADQYAPVIPFYIDGHKFNGIIDSGDDLFTIDASQLQADGITPEARAGTEKMVTIGGLASSVDIDRFATLIIGGEEFAHSWLRVTHGDDIQQDDAGIGLSYLRTHQVYIANDTQTIWLGTLIR